MICLIDGDLIAYRCAASCEKQGVVTEELGIAQARAHNLIAQILQANNTTDYTVYLSGGENYRKKFNPEYKANRKDTVPPVYLQDLREWIVVNHPFKLSDGVEADDLMGIEQTKYGDGSIICSLDKDMRQVPGWHFSWEITGTSTTGNRWTRPENKLYVSPLEGHFNFYWQMVMGDTSDNVFGFDGKARQKVPKFMESMYHEMQAMDSEEELFGYVRNLYNDDERFLMNGLCLYIQRNEGELWHENVQSLMEKTNDTGKVEEFVDL